MQRSFDLYRPLLIIPLQAAFAGLAVWLGTQLFSIAGYELLVQGQATIAAGAIPVPLTLWDIASQWSRRRALLRDLPARLDAAIEPWNGRADQPPQLAALSRDLQTWRTFADVALIGSIEEALWEIARMQNYEKYCIRADHITCRNLENLRRQFVTPPGSAHGR